MEIGRPVYSDELLHYQAKGAKWGVRRWQYPDGSLTPEGRIHYGVGPARSESAEKAAERQATEDIYRIREMRSDLEKKGEESKALRKAANRRRRLFESRKKYAEEMNEANRKANEAAEAYSKANVDLFNVRDEARDRYAKYQAMADEVRETLDALAGRTDITMQTIKDEEELEARWDALTDITLEYYYGQEFKETEMKRETDAYRISNRALANVSAREPKALADAIKNAKETVDITKISELKNIDTSEMSEMLRNEHKDTRMFDTRAKVENAVNKTVKTLLGDHAEDKFTTSWGQRMRIGDAVRDYIWEKALADSTEDIGDLTSMWEANSFYDVTDKLNRELRKQQKS
jgi:hypothetical protein